MKKRAEIKSREILVIGIISLIFCLTFVFAAHTVRISTGVLSYNVSEDLPNVYNITINSSAAENITQVNITLHTNFTFINYSNGTSITTQVAFANTSTILSWTNLTNPLVNGSGNGNNSFWFNATCITPGVYNFTVTTMNDTIGNNLTSTIINVTINDTTAPTAIVFTSPSTTGNANLSKNFTYINFSVTDNGVLDFINVSIYNASSGLIINSSGVQFPSGTANFTYNFTGMFDGQYTINITVNDSYNKTNTTVKRVGIDTVFPTEVSWGEGCAVNDSNLSQSNIYVNITNTTELNEKNVTLSVYYANGSPANVTGFADKRRAINVTGLADGNYTYNVTVCDYSNNCNSTTTTRTISLDTVAPALEFSCTPTTTTKAGQITCICSASDATSGVKTPASYLEHPDITEYGTFTTTCTSMDYAGNNASSSISYTVHGGSGSSSGGGGGGGAITKTYVPTDTQVSAGYTQELKSNERIKLTIASKIHYVAVTALTTTSATISVSSTPQTATLSIGEEKKFDITGDGYYDISAKLNGIKANKADITIKSIYEKIPAPEPVSAGAGVAVSEETTTETAELPEEAPSLAWLWIIVVIVVLVFVAVIIYKYKKK